MIWRLAKHLDLPEFDPMKYTKGPKIENEAWTNNVLSSFPMDENPRRHENNILPFPSRGWWVYFLYQSINLFLTMVQFLNMHKFVDSLILIFNYFELSNKHAANLILFKKIFPPTCLIRAYTFIYFWGKFPPTRLLEPTPLLIWGENPNYKITLSSYFLF